MFRKIHKTLKKCIKSILSDPAFWRLTIKVILTFIEWYTKK